MDLFEDHFSFYMVKNNNDNNLKAQCLSLNNIALTSSLDSSIALVITDTSIKTQVATSITHIYHQNCPIVKTIHHAINVTSMEAELFTIRYGINQATKLQGINKIIIVTDSIHSANKYLTIHCVLTESTVLLSLMNYIKVLVLITPTSLNSISPQVTTNSFFTMWSILKLENISKIHLSYRELCGTSAKKVCVIILLTNRK